MPNTMRHAFDVSAYGEHTDGQKVEIALGMQDLKETPQRTNCHQ